MFWGENMKAGLRPPEPVLLHSLWQHTCSPASYLNFNLNWLEVRRI